MVDARIACHRKGFHLIDGEAAAWDIHVGGDDPKSGDEVTRTIQGVKDRFLKWNPKTQMKTVIFEENGNRHDMQRALGHATNVNAVRRFGDFVLADCAANCLQPDKQNDNGWDQGQIFLDPSGVWLAPPAYANQLLRQANLPIRVQSNGPSNLDIVAAKSQDGRSVSVTIVNVGGQPITATIDLGSYVPARGVVTSIAGGLDAVNLPEKMLVTPIARAFSLTTMTEIFQPHSITTIRFSRA